MQAILCRRGEQVQAARLPALEVHHNGFVILEASVEIHLAEAVVVEARQRLVVREGIALRQCGRTRTGYAADFLPAQAFGRFLYGHVVVVLLGGSGPVQTNGRREGLGREGEEFNGESRSIAYTKRRERSGGSRPGISAAGSAQFFPTPGNVMPYHRRGSRYRVAGCERQRGRTGRRRGNIPFFAYCLVWYGRRNRERRLNARSDGGCIGRRCADRIVRAGACANGEVLGGARANTHLKSARTVGDDVAGRRSTGNAPGNGEVVGAEGEEAGSEGEGGAGIGVEIII